MTRINNRSIARIAVSFSAAALVAVVTALPTFANGTTPGTSNLTVTPGSLGAGISFADFIGVTLNGAAQRPTTTLLLTDIVDPTGSGAGWRITLTMPVFANSGATHSLAASSLSLTNTPVISAVDQSSGDPALLTRGPGLTALTALDTGVGVILVKATAGNGMGSYNVAPIDLRLNLPATTFATTYTSAATVGVISGP